MRKRGSALYGALLTVTIVCLAAVVMVAPRHPVAPIDFGERLHAFLRHGPGPGLWEIHTLNGTQAWFVSLHPDEPGCVLVAPEASNSGQGEVEVHARRRLARLWIPGDETLFRRNYHLLGEPYLEETSGLIRAHWVPNHEWGGETGRSLAVDPVTHEVRNLEDKSWKGRCVRCLHHTSDSDVGLEPPVEGESETCGGRDRSGPKPPAVLASEVPFALLAPTYLPPGFALVDSRYMNGRVKLPPAEEGGEPRMQRVQLAVLAYSDGLANIDIAVASPEDLDAFEAGIAASHEGPQDPTGCPPVPPRTGPVKQTGMLIRRRHDSCRTVLRLDGRAGVSVRLLGRNELPPEEYVHVLASVERVMPSAPPPTERDK